MNKRLPTLAEYQETGGKLMPVDLPHLTELQEAFVRELLLSPNNATRAYLRAGGQSTANPMTAAHVLRHNPNVVAHLLHRRAQLQAKNEDLRQLILDKCTAIIQASHDRFQRVQADGSCYTDLSDLSPQDWAAVQQIDVEEYTEGRGEDAREIKRIKVKLHDPMAAMDKAAKILGLFAADKVELTGRGGGPVQAVQMTMTPQEAAEAYAALRDGR